MSKDTGKDFLAELQERYPALSGISENIRAASRIINSCFRNSGTLFVCGNGGSYADAEHIVGELSKGFLKKRPVSYETGEKMNETAGEDVSDIFSNLQCGFKAMTLAHNSALSTAFANDVEPELCYAQQIFIMGSKGDVLIGISTSGNAGNILAAFRIARAIGVKTVLLTGCKHGKCEKYADCVIPVPESETFKIQEYHLPVYHALCAQAEEEFFGNGK